MAEILLQERMEEGIQKAIEIIYEEPIFGGPELINDNIKKTELISVPILKELGLYINQ